MITRYLLPLICFGFLSAAASAREDEPRFQVLPSTVIGPERGPIKSYVLVTDTTRFNFIPSPDMALEVDAKGRRVKLTPGDHKSTITFLVSTNDPSLLGEPGQIALHNLVQQRYTNAVSYAQPCYTGSGGAVSFDVEQVTTNKARLFTRIAFVPFPQGMAEFTLTTAPTNYHTQRLRFANLLSSLMITPASPSALKRSQPGRSQEVSR